MSASGKKYRSHIKPMLARLHDAPFNDSGWLFEVKWDGYRAIAEIEGNSVRLYSRNGLSFEAKYPVIVSELKRLNIHAVLDGEVVALDERGRPVFQKLQLYEQYTVPIIYYVFDCLVFEGNDQTRKPLIERKQLLKKILPESNVVLYCDHYMKDGIAFFNSIRDNDLEGMVAKQIDSQYWPGRRTDSWLKIKNHFVQEAVIAGYTAPRRSRQYFGALILGLYKNGTFKYVGHTGTGFTDTLLKDIYEKLKPLVRNTSPFKEKVKVNAPVTWIEPELVCNIKYTEITDDGYFRHPVFMGLRMDKRAEEITNYE